MPRLYGHCRKLMIYIGILMKIYGMHVIQKAPSLATFTLCN